MGLFRKKKDDEAVDPEERSPQPGIKYKDLMVMNELMKLGADLSQPRHVNYFLYAPDSRSAEAMAVEAREHGLLAKTSGSVPDPPGQ
ncbi:ribonuclease E inhibitor RraB [Actinomadura barringtoniae]|uniref:Ribonuclease E inhibitor RraB n=1 Tax=Actinomadura barringtoniae TaxID=1427535 RepID=A0A939T970_9ACTN|nr:ribonuclease E inhibitor RraB [Actinomadura barringtoniae]MBO2453939.1 ribonuclease E inhibitor RraB [Actinomadura barringtoniae]